MHTYTHTHTYKNEAKLFWNNTQSYYESYTLIFSILFYLIFFKNAGCDPLNLFYDHLWVEACSLKKPLMWKACGLHLEWEIKGIGPSVSALGKSLVWTKLPYIALGLYKDKRQELT